MTRISSYARNASLPYPVALGETLDIPSVPVRRYDRKCLRLFTTRSGGNRIFSSESGSHVRGPFCQAVTLIVSDIVVVAFIEAYPGGRSPYVQLPETTPPLVEAPPRSEAPPAETGTDSSPRV